MTTLTLALTTPAGPRVTPAGLWVVPIGSRVTPTEPGTTNPHGSRTRIEDEMTTTDTSVEARGARR